MNHIRGAVSTYNGQPIPLNVGEWTPADFATAKEARDAFSHAASDSLLTAAQAGDYLKFGFLREAIAEAERYDYLACQCARYAGLKVGAAA